MNRNKKVDETHQKTSALIVSAADWIDSFFDDERAVLEENTSRAQLRLSFAYTRFDQFEFSPRVNIKLELPKLSKKAFFIISTSDSGGVYPEIQVTLVEIGVVDAGVS